MRSGQRAARGEVWEMDELFADIKDYLREQQRPVAPSPPLFCRECGGRIVPGNGAIALELLRATRRCAACYNGDATTGA